MGSNYKIKYRNIRNNFKDIKQVDNKLNKYLHHKLIKQNNNFNIIMFYKLLIVFVLFLMSFSFVFSDLEFVYNSLQVFDSNGNKIEYFHKGTNSIKICIGIDANVVKTSNTFLTIDSKQYTASSCSKKDYYTCCFNVNVNIQQSESKDLKFIYKDGSRDYDYETSFDFNLDEQGPEFIEFVLNDLNKPTQCLGKDNWVYVRLNEETGLKPSQIYLEYGYKTQAANKCLKLKDSWICLFKNVKITSGMLNNNQGNPEDNSEKTITLSLSKKTTDVLGNHIQDEETAQDYCVDLTDFKLLSIKKPNFVGKNLPFEIKFYVNKHGFVKINDNYFECNPYGSQTNNEPTDDQNTNNNVNEQTKFECVAQLTLEKTTTLKYKIFDDAGNKIEDSIKIKVLNVNNGLNPNYLTVSEINIQPELIDQDAVNHGLKAIADIKFKGSAKIADLDFNCNVDSNILDVGEKEVLVQFVPSASELSCDFQIYEIINHKITANPQVINFNKTLNFYQMRLGTINEAIQNKLENAENNALVNAKWIKTLEDLLRMAETLCKVLNILHKIDTALSELTQTSYAIPFIGNSIGELQKQVDKTYNSAYKALHKFCAYVNCEIIQVGNGNNAHLETATLWNKELIPSLNAKFNNPFSNSKNFVLKDILGKGSAYDSPKSSILLSLATGCLPGVIHGLYKAQQIECMHLYCIKNAINNEMPLSECDYEHSSLLCEYVYGELFQVIPFASFFQGILSQVSSIFKDPISTLFAGIQFYCDKQPQPAAAFCSSFKLIRTLGSIYYDFKSIIDSFSSFGKEDICDKARNLEVSSYIYGEDSSDNN